MNTVNILPFTVEAGESYWRLAQELAQSLANYTGYSPNVFDNCKRQMNKIGLGGIVLGYPPSRNSLPPIMNAGAVVALTMFESDTVPPIWITNLNEYDHVIVPSRFLVDVLVGQGLKKPISVVPLGINPQFMQPKLRQLSPDAPLIILATLDRALRKGWAYADMGVAEAFGGDESKAVLVAKARFSSAKIDDVISENVVILQGYADDVELTKIYHAAHVMLFPSHGEGFGLPPREFAATGGIALATDWGGTQDNIDRWGWKIPCTMESAWQGHPSWDGHMGMWAKPDHQSIVNMLRDIRLNFGKYAEQAYEKAQFVSSHYKWEFAAQRIAEIWSQTCQHRQMNAQRTAAS